MVLEATMICVDNSEWMRNEDYPPSRMVQQCDAASFACSLKMQGNPGSSVGVLAMAGRGRGVSVPYPPTDDFGEVYACIHGMEIGGEANLTVAIQVAQLALKNRKNKRQQQRIIVFVGSPVIDDKNVLETLGEKLKKNNVALDVVDFGEYDDEKPEKLEALVAAASSGGNSHIIHVHAGEDLLSDAIISSPILATDQAGRGFAAAAIGASSYEFSVDPNVDPNLALVLQVSTEEDRARQEAAAEESFETYRTTHSCSPLEGVCKSGEQGEALALAEDKGTLDQLLRQSHAMSIEDYSAEDLRAIADEVEFVLQMPAQEQETSTQPDMFGDQEFAQYITYDFPGVELYLSKKDLQEWHELLTSPRQVRKQRKEQMKEQQRKHEEKEDEPEGDKNQ
ncbi:unnamed protein product [Urochloa decumbens]|uniref:26S proteasome non-ATPase regulatory subunit 4 homolog n=1 Tax=Urochloa decumbens TaxID=240449 RepID=A0ABC8XDA6_9POAL